jgi:hypothetical protein
MASDRLERKINAYVALLANQGMTPTMAELDVEADLIEYMNARMGAARQSFKLGRKYEAEARDQ